MNNSRFNRRGIKFLFLGDSITDGGRGRNGDPNHIYGHGYVFNIVSYLGSQLAEYTPRFYNRGVGGEASKHILIRWQQDALAIRPDVMTLLAGVNDLLQLFEPNSTLKERSSVSVEAYEENLRMMLTRSRKQNQDLMIFLGLPFYYHVKSWDEIYHDELDEAERNFTLDFRKVTQKEYQQKLQDICARQDIVRKIAVDFNAVLLDFPDAFTKAFHRAPVEYWTWDGVHPTAAGHQLLSQVWLDSWKQIQ